MDFNKQRFVLSTSEQTCLLELLLLYCTINKVITGDWSTAALDPGVRYSTVCEGGFRFMAARVREEEKASENRQGKRKAEEADKGEAAPGVTVASLRLLESR